MKEAEVEKESDTSGPYRQDGRLGTEPALARERIWKSVGRVNGESQSESGGDTVPRQRTGGLEHRERAR